MASIYLRGAFLPREGGPGTFATYSFTIERSGAGLAAAEYSWSVAGASGPGLLAADANDFAGGLLPFGTVSFAAGQIEAPFKVLVAGDSLVEFNEMFRVTLGDLPVGDVGARTSTAEHIFSDDTSLSIGAIDATRTEGSSGTTDFTFMVYRNGASMDMQGVDWAVTGLALPGMMAAGAADFAGAALPSGTVTFAPNEFRRAITVKVAADGAIEHHEGFAVTLSNPTGGAAIGRATATGSILNDDGARYSIAADTPMQREGDGAATDFTFTVTRTGTAAAAHTLDWSTADGGIPGTVGAQAADFAGGVLPSGTVTFAPGELRQTITVSVAGDELRELNESFIVTLANPSAGAALGRAGASAAILNDDAEIAASGGGLTEGTEGNDVFLIGSGSQQVLGLGGVDRFILAADLLADAQADIAVIGDFDAAGGELIDLSRIDAIAGTGANDAFSFIGTAAFSGTAGELSVADIGDGLQMVAGDVNGDAVGDFAVLLLLPPTAESSWFLL
jgi:hypothetical protein